MHYQGAIMNISLVILTCASLVEIRLEVHVRIQTGSYADLVADAEADKPGCTATEDDQRLEISDLESRGIVLSV